jgi:hypothetical protein
VVMKKSKKTMICLASKSGNKKLKSGRKREVPSRKLQISAYLRRFIIYFDELIAKLTICIL